MPVKPDSRFAGLPVLAVVAPDGSQRHVVALPIGRVERAAASRPHQPHQVVQGEALDLLARRYFGDEGLWWRILDANPLVYPLDLEAGDVIDIPAPGQATRAVRSRTF